MKLFSNKKQEDYKTSKFWLGNWSYKSPYTNPQEKSSADLLKLASVRRSVANFVKIVTGKNIPVKYRTQDMSGTDGKVVVISPNIDNIDVTVGTALHEGSHILLTNFSLFYRITDNPQTVVSDKFRDVLMKKYNFDPNTNQYIQYLKKLRYLFNYVEDRRIDMYIYENAPGYRGYYESLYEAYWNSEEISKSLQSSKYRDETWESYIHRIINLTNEKRDLNALKGLKEIYDTIDLKNIQRLTSSQDVLNVSLKIFEIAEKYIDPVLQKQEEKEKQEQEGDGEGQEGEDKKQESDNQKSKSNDSNKDESLDKNPGKDDNKESLQSIKEEDFVPMTPEEEEKLKEAMQKQKDFLDGKTDDEELDEEKATSLNAMEESGVQEVQVARDTNMTISGYTSCPVIVVKNFTKSLLDSDPYGIFPDSAVCQEEVNEGIVLGKLLGKKLKVRDEEKSLKTTRLRTGKIDKRLMHGIGYGAEQIFERTLIDKFKPVHVHISVDASGSMSGSKWSKAQKAVVAIAKAASMVSNLNIVISYRYTSSFRGSYNKMLPLVLVAYDSKKDPFKKIESMFGYLTANSATPESLCFEATMDLMIEGGQGVDSYFINFSDGKPAFQSEEIRYSGGPAVNHCRKMMNAYRYRGIKVLSYFISSGYDGYLDDFKRMYGQDATDIDVNQIVPLAKTLNKMFSEKE